MLWSCLTELKSKPETIQLFSRILTAFQKSSKIFIGTQNYPALNKVQFMILASNQPSGQGKEANDEEEGTMFNLSQKFRGCYSCLLSHHKAIIIFFTHQSIV